MTRRPWARRRRAALGAAALLAVPVLPVAGFLWFLRAAAMPPVGPERRAEGIAVLTGGAERVETGLRLLQADGAARLIVSGVGRNATLADLVRGAGLSPELAESVAGRVTLGHAAASTRGNAAEIAAWARERDIGSVRVVTAGYHMPRALLELRRALPGAALLAHPVVPAALRAPAGPRVWRLLVGEYSKLIGAWLGLGARPGSAGKDPAPAPPGTEAGRVELPAKPQPARLPAGQ
jgi:uncharacterized SAM-binding protein YcdF (DUF218 family)